MGDKWKKADMGGVKYVKKKMPVIGVGTYQVQDESVLRDTLDEAFRVGYRFIDTAQVYKNEKTIGKILPDLLEKHSLNREEIFITSKVSPSNQGTAKTLSSVHKSLRDLGLEYIDLMLIHWPGCNRVAVESEKNATVRSETYNQLETLYKEGKLKSIGVSNYEISHLEELLADCSVMPAVNQCECHPHFPNERVAEYCKEHEIHFQAYSSLGSPSHVESLLKDGVVRKVAGGNGVTPAVVLLAWAINQGYSVLPRTEKVERVRENYQAASVTLPLDDMDRLSRIERRKRTCWDPTTVK